MYPTVDIPNWLMTLIYYGGNVNWWLWTHAGLIAECIVLAWGCCTIAKWALLKVRGGSGR